MSKTTSSMKKGKNRQSVLLITILNGNLCCWRILLRLCRRYIYDSQHRFKQTGFIFYITSAEILLKQETANHVFFPPRLSTASLKLLFIYLLKVYFQWKTALRACKLPHSLTDYPLEKGQCTGPVDAYFALAKKKANNRFDY